MESTVARPEGVKHSLHILLKSLIDYAGLFPPSGLDMASAVANYSRYRTSQHSWALGRFIVPAARLGEFETHFVPDRTPWHISALVGNSPAEDLARVVEFNARHHHTAIVDTLEAKAASAIEIAELRRQAPEGLIVYFEIPVDGDLKPLVESVRTARARAKIRTGGLTQEMFPSASQILNFLNACISVNVAFKATAGLHHPLRCTRALTYEKDSPVGTMHGFLNVFLASAFLLDGLPSVELETLLGDTDASHFEFGDSSIAWCGHRVTQARLLESRALAASFGSCSFEEPVGDLHSLNLL
jgi:hypothetical protein